MKKIWGAPPCGIAAFLLFSGLSSPQVFTLPVVLSLIGPAILLAFPRIFEALFFDLSVFFKCFKVIIPCKSAAVSLTSSLPPLVLSYRLPEVYLRFARVIIMGRVCALSSARLLSALRARDYNGEFAHYHLRRAFSQYPVPGYSILHAGAFAARFACGGFGGLFPESSFFMHVLCCMAVFLKLAFGRILTNFVTCNHTSFLEASLPGLCSLAF